MLVEEADSGGDLVRSRVALHLGGIDQDIHGMMAALEHVENVAQRGGLRRCDNADARGQRWDRLLAFGGEQAFGFEFGLELLEGQLQRTGAFGLDVFGRNLQFAAIFVDGDASAHDDLQAVGGAKAQQARRRAEHHDANLRRCRL